MGVAGDCLGYRRYSELEGGGKYVHREVAERMLGRELLEGEVVHHIDSVRSNNHPSNLMVFKTSADHTRHHNETGVLIQLEDGAYIRYVEPKVPKVKVIQYKIDWPSREELHKLVWSKPCHLLAKEFGVSDNAIGKRCKALGIPKPPRGWWNKLDNEHMYLSCPLP